MVESPAGNILSRTSGFIAQARFTRSLTPARNRTFGCTSCCVPTMRVYGGLKFEDRTHRGKFKQREAELPNVVAVQASLLKLQLVSKRNQVGWCPRIHAPFDAAKQDWLRKGINHDSLPHAVADNRSPLGDLSCS
jgi:hypothetical protein